MIDQIALTIVAPIKPGSKEDLRQLLLVMGKDPANNDLIPFGKLSGTHFARLFILDEAIDLKGSPIAPYLVYLSDVDAPVEHHLDELVDLMGAGLDRLFGHCADYPGVGSVTPGLRRAYLLAHAVSAAAVYVNTLGRTLQEIREDAQLREAIEGFLDKSRRDWSTVNPGEIRAAIQTFVNGEASLSWTRSPSPGFDAGWWLRETIGLIGIPLLLILVSPLALVALPFWLAILRRLEQTDVAENARPNAARVEELVNLEDYAAQNPFTASGLVKPGPFRWLTMKLVLWLAGWGTRHIFNDGDLAGVKTIHFARWVPIDGDRRVLFASYYDGSQESYMDDFIDKEAWGLNAVFSNGVGYPKTNWLVLDGAKDEQAFKDFLRSHQTPTPVWYSAYDRLTTLNINKNAQIRAGLYGSLSDSQIRDWLGLL